MDVFDLENAGEVTSWLHGAAFARGSLTATAEWRRGIQLVAGADLGTAADPLPEDVQAILNLIHGRQPDDTK